GPRTFPSSDANEGGPSFVVLEDFSPPAAEMTFVYRIEGEEGITPLPGLSLDLQPVSAFGAGTSITRFTDAEGGLLGVNAGDDPAGNAAFRLVDADGGGVLFSAGGGSTTPAVAADGVLAYLTRAAGGEVRLTRWRRQGAA